GADGEVEGIAFLELQVGALGRQRGSGDLHLGHDFAIVQDVFLADGDGGCDEELLERDGFFAVRAGDGDGGAEGDEHGGQVGGVDVVRPPAAEDGVVFVFAVDGEA